MPPLHAAYPRIASLLRRTLPDTTVALFAEPVAAADGAIDWVTPLAGQPVPLAALPPAERTAVEAVLRERLATVRALAGKLAGGPDAAIADDLRRAAVDPPADQVFVMNGQPVVIGWGQQGSFASAPPLPPVPPVPPAAVAAAAPPPRRWWRWLLLGLLLLLLLAALAWFLRGCDKEEVPPPPPAAEPAPPPKDDSDLDDLRAKIRAAEDEIRRRLDACPVPEAPKAEVAPQPEPPKAAEPPKVEPKKVEPKPEPKKVEPKKIEPKPEPPKTEPKKAEPKPAAPAPEPQKQAACPPQRQAWERPEVVLMLDSSGSMRLPKDMSEAQVETLIRRAMRGDRAALAQVNNFEGGPNSRLGAAKDAVREVTKRMPPDVDIGLLVFGRCEDTDSYHFFKPDERQKMLGLLAGIQPRQGTPLARGLERSGNMMDGTSIPGVIVVVTDGEDSCGGDPCAVARALKARKPQITINVIDVGGSGKGRCMAEATGGRVIRPQDGQPWGDVLMQATNQTPLPPGCR